MRAAEARWVTRWFDAQPWHTNLALGLIGLALLAFTRQLIAEYDHYQIGFSGVSSAQVVLYVGAVLVLLVRPANVDRWTFPIILTVAILCRLVTLYPEPFLSSDVYRYVWDGVVQHAHINPYRYVPSNAALSFLQAPNQDTYDNINRRDYARTIYPPVAQVLFYAITWISPTVTAMKTAMILFEGLTLWGLVRLLREMGLRREWTLLYAWFPMLIWELGGSGHLDAIVIAFMVLALLFRYRRQPVWTGVFLGLAVLTKFYPLVLFPALYQRGDWKMPATMAGLAAFFYALYLSAGTMVFGFLGGYVQEEGMDNWTRYFLLEWVQHLRGLHGTSNTAYMLLCALVLAGLTGWAFLRSDAPGARRDAFLAPAFGLALGMMLLFSPHYPWYAAWLVPFLVFVPSLTGTTYVLALFYLCTTKWAVGTGPKQFHLNEMLYAAVIVAALVELALRRLPASRGWFMHTAPETAEER